MWRAALAAIALASLAAVPLAMAQAKSEAANLAGAASATADSGGAGGPLERMVDDHFANIHRQVTGQPAPIDDTLKIFNELYTQLSAVDAAQKSKSPPPPGGAAEKVKAERAK